MSPRATYLLPYREARERRERGARALLWDEKANQTVRFEAILRTCPVAGLRVLDVGCGPADLLGFLRKRGLTPAHYVGLEAQTWLVDAARRRRYPRCTIVEADFVSRPEALAVGADVIVFSGSLNLLSSRQFYAAIRHAWKATRRWLAFNFLCSPCLTGEPYLHWHRRRDVLALARELAPVVRSEDGYEDGDCTVVMGRPLRRP
jgi:hypothetical protein